VGQDGATGGRDEVAALKLESRGHRRPRWHGRFTRRHKPVDIPSLAAKKSLTSPRWRYRDRYLHPPPHCAEHTARAASPTTGECGEGSDHGISSAGDVRTSSAKRGISTACAPRKCDHAIAAARDHQRLQLSAAALRRLLHQFAPILAHSQTQRLLDLGLVGGGGCDSENSNSRYASQRDRNIVRVGFLGVPHPNRGDRSVSVI